MKAYIVTNGQGHWRVIGDNTMEGPSFISDWCLEEFAPDGDDAIVAFEIDVPVAHAIDNAPQVLIVPVDPVDVPD